MELLNFLQLHDNWESLLTKAPYFLAIEKNKQYVMFNKQKFLSEDNPITQEAHCAIFTYTNKWECVNYPFPHIKHYEDKTAPDIDWRSSTVISKIDGDLICIWWHNNCWHYSYEYSLNANESFTLKKNTRFELIQQAVGNLQKFEDFLEPYCCYTFILTYPENKIITDYGESPKLWYISRRNLKTFKEELTVHSFGNTVYLPRKFPGLNNFKVLKNLELTLEKDEPGYIVVDYAGNRVKVDGIRYKKIRNLYGDNTLDKTTVIELWQKNQLDDWIKNFGNYPIIETSLNELEYLRNCAEDEWKKFKDLNDITFKLKLPQFFPWTSSYLLARKEKPINIIEYQKKAKINDLLSELQVRNMMDI